MRHILKTHTRARVKVYKTDALMHCCIRFLTIFAEHLHVSIILCTFAAIWRSVANQYIFLLTALAIIRIQISFGNFILIIE